MGHVETLQLMDVPLLIEHVVMVLDHCERLRAERLDCSNKEQELIVMYYFASLMRHAEALNNSELLAKAKEYGMLQLAVKHILRHATAEYPEEYSHEIFGGLAAMCDNEDFRTNWQDFFRNELGEVDREQMQMFMQLKDFVDPILAAYPDKKREFRPLTDFFNTLTRKMG